MPHDKNGRELKKGDRVTMEFEVTAVHAGATACNVNLMATDPARTGEYTPVVVCNARLTTKLLLILLPALLLFPAPAPAGEPVRFKDCAACGPACGCQLGKCPDGCPAAPAADPTAALCLVHCGTACGCGTVVWSEAGSSVVVTTRHVFGFPGPVRVEHAGKSYPGRHTDLAAGNDLAVVFVAGELPAAALAPADPRPGDEIRHWGATTGPAAGKVTGRGTDPVGGPSVASSFDLISGDSGSGVFDSKGRLVGVNWGFEGIYRQRGPSGFVPVSSVTIFVWERGVHFPRLRAKLQPAVERFRAVRDARRGMPGPGCVDAKCNPTPPPGATRPPADPFSRPGGCPGGTCPPAAIRGRVIRR